MCTNLNLKGIMKIYNEQDFKKQKNFKFAYGWNVGVEAHDHCSYDVNIPADYKGTLDLIPSGLNYTSAIVAYNNRFSFDVDNSKDDWYIMDSKILKELKKESSYKSATYDVLMPRVNGQDTNIKIMYIAHDDIDKDGSDFNL